MENIYAWNRVSDRIHLWNYLKLNNLYFLFILSQPSYLSLEYAVMEGILIRTLNGQLLQSITDDKFKNPETIKFSQNGEFFVIYRNVSRFGNKIYSYPQMNNRINTSNIEEFQKIKTMNMIKIKFLICLDLRFIELFV